MAKMMKPGKSPVAPKTAMRGQNTKGTGPTSSHSPNKADIAPKGKKGK